MKNTTKGMIKGMTDAQFNRLIKKAGKACAVHAALMASVAEECVKRYGVTWSDVDCDGIIDCIDHLGDDDFSLDQFHAAMIDALNMRGLINDDGSIIHANADNYDE